MEDSYLILINMQIAIIEKSLFTLNDYLSLQSTNHRKIRSNSAHSPNVINKNSINNYISSISRGAYDLTKQMSKNYLLTTNIIDKKILYNHNNFSNQKNKNTHVTSVSLPDSKLITYPKLTKSPDKINDAIVAKNNYIAPLPIKKCNQPSIAKHDQLLPSDRWSLLCKDEETGQFIYASLIKLSKYWNIFRNINDLKHSFKLWSSQQQHQQKQNINNRNSSSLISSSKHISTQVNSSNNNPYISVENDQYDNINTGITMNDIELSYNDIDNDGINDTNINDYNNYNELKVDEYNNKEYYNYEDSYDEELSAKSFSPEIFDASSGEPLFSNTIIENGISLSIDDYWITGGSDIFVNEEESNFETVSNFHEKESISEFNNGSKLNNNNNNNNNKFDYDINEKCVFQNKESNHRITEYKDNQLDISDLIVTNEIISLPKQSLSPIINNFNTYNNNNNNNKESKPMHANDLISRLLGSSSSSIITSRDIEEKIDKLEIITSLSSLNSLLDTENQLVIPLIDDDNNNSISINSSINNDFNNNNNNNNNNNSNNEDKKIRTRTRPSSNRNKDNIYKSYENDPLIDSVLNNLKDIDELSPNTPSKYNLSNSNSKLLLAKKNLEAEKLRRFYFSSENDASNNEINLKISKDFSLISSTLKMHDPEDSLKSIDDGFEISP